MSKNDEKPKKKNKSSILTKYELNVIPRLKDIGTWVREGVTEEDIAKRLGIHVCTLTEYKSKHIKLAEVLEKPTKWETHVLPRLSEIQEWFENGVPMDKIYKNLSIAPATWYEYVDKHPVLAELVKWGRAFTNISVENSLFRSATGYEYEEIKTVVEEDKNGKKRTRIEKVKRHMPPNPTAMVFWLKNRVPTDWNDRREIVVSTKAAELERKQLFLQMIDADTIEAEYEQLEESTEDGFEESEMD
ncbi:MAG: transposase [Bacilli bacterium]|nr:transposase [Bacilli bacterium]